MLRSLMSPMLALTCLVALPTAAEPTAKVGDPAAPLAISSWVKGDPVNLEAVRDKKVVVVEFWATWCGPCRTSIPHLTELAKKYKNDVIFVGVSNESADVIAPFVEQMGEQMDYVVAADTDNKTFNAYMRAYGQGGIPHAFIVDREGRVAWHAHPMVPEFESALKAIVAGDFDPEAMVKQREHHQKMLSLVQEYHALASKPEADSGRLAEMETALEQGAWDSEMMLNALAWPIAARNPEHRNLEFALRAAKRACELTEYKNGNILDTYAKVLWEMGRKDDAVKYQKLAVERAEAGGEHGLPDSVIAPIKLRLAEYTGGNSDE